MANSDFLKNAMMASGVGGIGTGALQALFGGDNPYDKASDYFDKVPGTISPYYNPYITAGRNALGDITDQYHTLINDPGSLLTKFSKGFTSSPGYDFEKNEGLNGINNAAAAGGMLGTASHQRSAGDLSTNLASKDFNSYLQNILGLYGKGLSGEEGINQIGYNASDSLATSLAQALMNQGGAAMQGAQYNNQNRSNIFGDLAGGVADLFFA